MPRRCVKRCEYHRRAGACSRRCWRTKMQRRCGFHIRRLLHRLWRSPLPEGASYIRPPRVAAASFSSFLRAIRESPLRGTAGWEPPPTGWMGLCGNEARAKELAEEKFCQTRRKAADALKAYLSYVEVQRTAATKPVRRISHRENRASQGVSRSRRRWRIYNTLRGRDRRQRSK